MGGADAISLIPQSEVAGKIEASELREIVQGVVSTNQNINGQALVNLVVNKIKIKSKKKTE